MKKILVIFGTRPEAIKMAPVIMALRQSNNDFIVKVCVTAQHRSLLDQVLHLFNIVPDFDLDIMTASQSLSDVTCRVLTGLESVLSEYLPDVILVHGDTTTTMAATMSAFYHKIDVGHVEAGLRTGNIYSPWPEEVNRRITSVISKLHFSPTADSKYNLINEGVDEKSIYVTGNTVIDSLLYIVEKIKSDKKLSEEVTNNFRFLNINKRLILVTCHRRENFGKGFENICNALIKIVESFDDIEIVYPVHPNPNIKEPVYRILANKEGIHLISPQDYLPFVYLMDSSYLILTDSGGVQEEAPSLGKPVLVLRENTERPEALEAGTAKLVGTNTDNIYMEVSKLLCDKEYYQSMSTVTNPYGDGNASERIVNALISFKL